MGTHRFRTDLSSLSHIPCFCPRNINDPINDRMRDMHALWPKLPRQTLCHSPESEFGPRKASEPRRPLETRRCPGKDHCSGVRPLLMLQQQREQALAEVEGAHDCAIDAGLHVLDLELKEWFASELARGIEDCCSDIDVVAPFILDGRDHGFHALAVGDVGGYADSLASTLVDLLDEVGVVLRGAGEERNWVLLCKAEGNGGAGLEY